MFYVRSGCNPKLKNREGLLPRQIARDAGHKAAAKELKKAEIQHGQSNSSDDTSLMSDLWALTLHDWSYEHESEIRQAFENPLETVPEEMFSSVLEKLKAPVDLDQLHTVIAAHDKDKVGYVNVNEFIKGVSYIEKPFLLSSYVPKKKKEKSGTGGKKKEKSVPPVCTFPPEHMPRRPDGGPPSYMIEKYYNCHDTRRFSRDHPPQHPIMDDSEWYLEKPEKVYVSVNSCAKMGDLESLDLAFSQGTHVDVKDQYCKTPLMVACSSGNYEVAQYLISQG